MIMIMILVTMYSMRKQIEEREGRREGKGGRGRREGKGGREGGREGEGELI